MNIQRFTAPTSREALAKARMAFGDGTLILSNRPTENGVEVVATAEDSIGSLQEQMQAAAPRTAERAARMTDATARDSASKVADDAAQLAMSTLSFQDYVRERMMRKRQEALLIEAPDAQTPAPATKGNSAPGTPRSAQAMPSAKTAARQRNANLTTDAMPKGILDELHAMKAMMEDRFSALAWLGHARQDPIQSNLMLKLIRAGYSPNLARTILEKMPDGLNASESVQWVVDVLERNLKTDSEGPLLHEEGGVFALVGATGVGKTTTTAKLAGICPKMYGPASVGLITLDTYRVGAHEQLRVFGRMLGVVAHLAHDQTALQDLLGLLSNKKMVLVDTAGLAPRDPRRKELMETLNIPGIKRLLVLHAGSHGDSMDESIAAFKHPGPQHAILSKLDEAVRLGTALDAAIRNQLIVRGVATGQRVPEDWESADAAKLVRQSMRSAGSSAFDPKTSDLGYYFGQSDSGPSFKVQFDA